MTAAALLVEAPSPLAGHRMIDRAYKTELDPTVEQRRLLARHVAGARVAYNWAFARWRDLYATYCMAVGLRALAGLDAATGRALWAFGLGLHALTLGEPVERKAKRQKKGSAPKTKLLFRVRLPYDAPEAPPNADAIHKDLTAEKHRSPELGWLAELSAFAVREAVQDVGKAYENFFRRLKKHQRGDHSECQARQSPPGCDLGEPHFRSRSNRRWHADQPDPIRVTDRAIKIPKVGWVRLKERGYLPVTRENSHELVSGGRCAAVGLSEAAGRWYVSLRASRPAPMPLTARGPGKALREHPLVRIPGKRLGVEVGVRHLVVTSDGSVDVKGIREAERLAMYERKLTLWQRRMSRRLRKNGAKALPRREQSRGWHEAHRQVRLYHRRATELRDYVAGRAARQVVDTGAETLVLRGAFVADMKSRAGKTDKQEKTRRQVAGWVQIARMGDVRRRIEYKQAWAAGTVELTETSYPSSRRCSVCGAVRPEDPGYPDFHCPACGHTEDRELNSAKNLRDSRSPSGDPVAPAGLAGANPGGSASRIMPSGTGNTTTPSLGEASSSDRPRNRTRAKTRGTASGLRKKTGDQPDGPSGPNDPHYERSSDDDMLPIAFPLVTAGSGADDPHRSQTTAEVHGLSSLPFGPSKDMP